MNSLEKRTNQFAMGYMVNPTLHANKAFRYQVENFPKETLHQSTMKAIIML